MEENKMKHNAYAYFLAGYAYALAEKIVRDKEIENQTFLTKTERMEEINYVWGSIIRGC